MDIFFFFLRNLNVYTNIFPDGYVIVYGFIFFI